MTVMAGAPSDWEIQPLSSFPLNDFRKDCLCDNAMTNVIQFSFHHDENTPCMGEKAVIQWLPAPASVAVIVAYVPRYKFPAH